MTDAECVALLQWALPQMRLRWRGYRKVRRQVGKRIQRRMNELGLPDVASYRARLESEPDEWPFLRRLCIVTISRFYRDRGTWDAMRDQVLPAVAEVAIAAGDDELRCWSIGCASGEEPYTLSIAWTLDVADRFPDLRLRVLATDVDEHMLERARAAEYPAGTLRELPTGWRDRAFEPRDGLYRLRDRFRTAVEFVRADVRDALPDDSFHVIACRNLVCTYFDEAFQRQVVDRIITRLCTGGAFVLGCHERPPTEAALGPWLAHDCIYRHHVHERGDPRTT